MTTIELLRREAEIGFRNTRSRDEEVKREDDYARLRAEMLARRLIKGGAVA